MAHGAGAATDARQHTTSYEYDALSSQSATGTFRYSLDGHLVASAVGDTWEYCDTNAVGNVVTVSAQAGSSSFTYNTHNADESLLTRTDASGTSSCTYDTSGRMHTDTDAATGATLAYSSATRSATPPPRLPCAPLWHAQYPMTTKRIRVTPVPTGRFGNLLTEPARGHLIAGSRRRGKNSLIPSSIAVAARGAVNDNCFIVNSTTPTSNCKSG